MLRTCSRSEMLKLWRTAAGLEPLRADCTVEAVEGLDADALIESRMRPWYLNLLDTAPPALLPVKDVSPELTVVATADASAEAWLPDSVRRLVELRLSGWEMAALPCGVEQAAERLRLAGNPYCAPGASHPLCVQNGRRIHLMPFVRGWTMRSALAVVDPGPDTYILDESLLSTIPDVLL